ncbi:DMT family transporter [Inhella gelatinilytica]|uniref:DMT family transporter n=1 Tax=Inhella gelatinilytica TaxID=2795030 RepID=A0A931NFH7_9BURK|nr:DMT family transporter [Inhella gelatinilytica]MBH9554255.1 DMT family transporter [Inhella gelatinilytica]
MSHRRALLLMVVVTLLWSSAGIVSRQLESARPFEVTFWRSAFTALTLLLWWGLREGRAGLAPLLHPSKALWASGLCWSVMFTAFMVAVSISPVAQVLVVMALGPLMTALLAWGVLKQPLPLRTLVAVGLAGAGVAWMFGGEAKPGLGALVAVAVPVAASINWIVLQRMGRSDAPVSLPHAVALGGLISALATLVLAWPFSASAGDLLWLAFLGAFQLAFPCTLVVHLTKVLSATEVALMAQLELLFGVAWVWWLAGEAPGSNTLAGGGLVLLALFLNELRRRSAPEKSS